MVAILSGHKFLMDQELRQEFTEARPYAFDLQGPNEASLIHGIIRIP